MKTSGVASPLIASVLLACLALVPAAHAADSSSVDAAFAEQMRELATAGARVAVPGVTRVDVQVGQLDPRLRLAECQRVEPYLPPGVKLWGKARIGLRCKEGPTPWNVYLPLTIKVYAKALVTTGPIAANSVITAADVMQAEVDLAEDPSAAVTDSELIVGRTLARSVNAGQSLRQSHIKPRQFFAAGDEVKVIAAGAGFSVAGSGQAVTPGLEGQPARVRTENGRILTGTPTGDRQIELAL